MISLAKAMQRRCQQYSAFSLFITPHNILINKAINQIG
ncbi:hypothetical protein ymoll0001_39270 [Yersinia mollaretii ATCC 43969]|uniref:Uncharacterized protein n=1 Tax=Yersinia mollaretii (strain ATCC 43969 / DSM 18520 / CIP 103324 / CNY 7263 / WAIP 204) TaxID=349967 RepID=A0ABP2EC62_YERMW|nr:hypothetical protein ymoll0001_39270 [Yersinia mollaretii ATCC 43969]